MNGDWMFIFFCILVYLLYRLISGWRNSTKKGGLAKSQEAAGNVLNTAGQGISFFKNLAEDLAYRSEQKSMENSLKNIKFTDIFYNVQARLMGSFYATRYHPEIEHVKYGPFPEDRNDNSWVYILFGFRKESGKWDVPNNLETVCQFKNDMLNNKELMSLCFNLNISYIVFSENRFIDDFRHSVGLKEFEVFKVTKDGFVNDD
jgi:hypothetical protein